MSTVLAVLTSLSVFLFGESKSTKQYVDELFAKSYATLDTNLDSSYFYADKALSLSESKNLEWHTANAKFIQGYVHEQKGQHSKAILLYLDAVNILADLDDSRSKKDHCNILINTANILRKHHKYEDALILYNDALNVANKYEFENKSTKILKIHFNKSLVYKEQGNYDLEVSEALICHELALDNSDENMMIISWNRLGLIQMENQVYDEAIAYFNKIINHPYRESNGLTHKGRAYHNLGYTYWEQGDMKSAETAYLKALSYKEIENNDASLFFTYKDLTELYLDERQYAKAIKLGDAATEIYERLPLNLDNYQLFKTLSLLNNETGNYELSTQYLNKYYAENEKFIAQRDFIAQQSDKFKLEVVLAGYYDQLESRQRIAILTNWLIGILVISLIIAGLGYWRWKWFKNQLEIELRSHFQEISDIFQTEPVSKD